MSNKTLKPCPFCDNEYSSTGYGTLAYHITCMKCGADIARKTEAEAIEAWNRRSSSWTPVSERLPERSGTYYTTHDFGDKRITSVNQYDVDVQKWYYRNPIAWFTIPKPYEEGK